MISTKNSQNSRENEYFSEIIYLLLDKAVPRNNFESSFLKWYNSFPDYKDKNQSYSVLNNEYKEYINNKKYYFLKIRERILIEIFRELNPESEYLLFTDYDDFRFGVDCIEQDKDWKFIWIDFTTDPKKEFNSKYKKTTPIDLYRNPNTPLEVRKNWIERKIYYFDEKAVKYTTRKFISLLKNWTKPRSFLEIYKSYLREKNIKRAKKIVSDWINLVF